MQDETELQRFAVFGHPIAHSLSPRIHARFAAQTGIRLQYSALDAPAGSFSTQLEDFAAAGGRGANVTLPLKQDACALSAALSDFARRAGAVNTLTRLPDGRWLGDNTDGPGFVRDLTERHSLDLRSWRSRSDWSGGARCATTFRTARPHSHSWPGRAPPARDRRSTASACWSN